MRGEGRLRHRVIEGTDGSRVPNGIWDAELESVCTPRSGGDDTGLCVPQTLYASGVYADDTCTADAVSYTHLTLPTILLV